MARRRVGLGQGLACVLAQCGLGWGLGLSLRLGSGLGCPFLPLALREASWLSKGRVRFPYKHGLYCDRLQELALLPAVSPSQDGH